jgi:homoserine/homoserine lactone efflux protein
MDLNSWMLYVGVVAVVIVLPGPAALLCVQHGLVHGRQRALATVLGGTLSAGVLMSVSALGLCQLLLASPLAFEVARSAGVACLVLLGLSAWHAAHDARPPTSTEALPATRRTLAALCGKGFLVGISNPKDLLFFGALLPQFLDAEAPRLPQFIVLFGTWAVIDALTMGGYAALGEQLQGWLACPIRMLQFQRASAALLIVAGALLAVSRSA